MAPKGQQPAEQHHVPRQQVQVTAGQTAPVAAPAGPEAVNAAIILPLGVVTRSDVSKSLRELQVIDDYFHQSAIRGAQNSTPPSLSKTLDALAEANNLNLIHAEHRAPLKEFLTKIKATAPVVHISFPSEPSAPFLAKILEWFRSQVHPHTVLHVGLQPELAAGCTVRTTNKIFDFSLRKRFDASKQRLLQSLEELDKAAEHEPVAAANATVPEGDRL